MELTVENIEKYFNLLNDMSKAEGISMFDLYHCIHFSDEEIKKFEDKKDTEMLEDEFKRYNLYWELKQRYYLIAQEFRKRYDISINTAEIEKFNNDVKKEYKHINKISKEIDKIIKGFDKSKEQKAADKKNAPRRARLEDVIKEDNNNFLNTIIEFGMCKTKIKQELCVDPDKLLLKDAFARYFKLVINGMFNG